jgi:hypothetical protein
MDANDDRKNEGVDITDDSPYLSDEVIRWCRVAFLGMVVMVLLMLIYLLAIAVLNHKGFCAPSYRILSDDEKIRIAIKDRLLEYPPAVIKEAYYDNGFYLIAKKVPDRPVHYKNVDEFLRLNPDCCSLSKAVIDDGLELQAIDFSDRIKGNVSHFMRLRYRVNYLNEKNEAENVTYSEIITISNCGNGKPFKWNP